MNTRENNVRTVHVGTATTLWQASALLSDKESVTWKQKASYLNLGWLAGSNLVVGAHFMKGFEHRMHGTWNVSASYLLHLSHLHSSPILYIGHPNKKDIGTTEP